MITEIFSGIDWMQFALGAGGVGAVALSGSRIMEFIDQWIAKVIRPGHRGYIILFGWAVRYRWRRKVRLLVLPPGVYLQVFIFLQVREFNVQDKPLPSSVGDQTISHWSTGRTLRLRMNARIQYGKDGRSALLSQIHKGDPDSIVRQWVAKEAIDIINRLPSVEQMDYDQFYRDVQQACDGLPAECGVAVTWLGSEDFAPSDQQILQDGLRALAAAISGGLVELRRRSSSEDAL